MINNLIKSTISNGQAQAERQSLPAPVDMICLNDVVQLMVNWLWYPYLPLGKLTAILGNPGEGKTYTVMNIIAACTNGRLLPGMKEPMQPFNVIYQTAEDGLGDTVKPRLIEAGADLTRVFSIDDTATLLTLSDERVEHAIRENDVKLCAFDPLQAFLGANVDMNRANEVRPILARLGKVAERTGCAIVFIGHLNKAAGILCPAHTPNHVQNEGCKRPWYFPVRKSMCFVQIIHSLKCLHLCEYCNTKNQNLP